MRLGTWRSGATAAVALGVGAVGGGGLLVKTYDWETVWEIDVPREEVFRALTTPDPGDNWWPSMAVQRVTTRPDGGGRQVVYRVHQAESVARLAPPFCITATATTVEAGRRLRQVVTGDLVGVLETHLYDLPTGATRVVFHWYVRVRQPLLNLLGYLAEPMFRRSHDEVMREGELGLRRYCASHRTVRQ